MKIQLVDKEYHFHIGRRNLRTALSTTLCALLYFLVGRNPTFACIGTIFGTGSDMSDSWLNGGNRFFGTVFGGLLGMLLFRIYICFYPDGSQHTLMFLFVFVGVMALVVICQLFRWRGAVQPGGVVLCIILFNTPVNTYVSYTLARIFDTGVGVAIALFMSWLLKQEKVGAFLKKAHIRIVPDDWKHAA